MIHDESDSESSMENYGLNSAVKRRGKQESATNGEHSDEVLGLWENAKTPTLNPNGSAKSITIDF
jgi:hypothetical protein